jgi:hypothetical protein
MLDGIATKRLQAWHGILQSDVLMLCCVQDVMMMMMMIGGELMMMIISFSWQSVPYVSHSIVCRVLENCCDGLQHLALLAALAGQTCYAGSRHWHSSCLHLRLHMLLTR